jgi:hypothetical protein
MKSFKSLKPKPRRSWNWAQNAPSVEVAPKTLPATKMILNPALCPFSYQAGDISGEARTGPALKPYSSLSLLSAQLLFVIGVLMFLYKGLCINAGGVGDVSAVCASHGRKFDAFPEALLNNLSESPTSPGEPCLHCSGWHSEELRRFANAQTIDIAQSKGREQNGREPRSRMSQRFRNLSLAICLFGTWSVIRHHVCREETLLATGFIQSDLYLWGAPT